MAKKKVLELLDSPILILRKIWMTEKSLNFHTVFSLQCCQLCVKYFDIFQPRKNLLPRSVMPDLPGVCHSLRSHFTQGSTTTSSASGSRPPSPIIEVIPVSQYESLYGGGQRIPNPAIYQTTPPGLCFWCPEKLMGDGITQCGNFKILQPFKFYVKSKLENLEVLKLPFLIFWRLWILLFWQISTFKKCKNS